MKVVRKAVKMVYLMVVMLVEHSVFLTVDLMVGK